MRHALSTALIMLLILLPWGLAEGVEDGSTWTRGDVSVTVDLRGTLHGDVEVTYTSGAESAVVMGTPDENGECVEAPSGTAGGNTFRIVRKGSDSVVQLRGVNDSGETVWRDLSTSDAPLSASNEATGSLPL